MENKYLKLARDARAENNSEDAKKYYDIVRTEDPENAEAKFFYQFYALYEGKNKDIASRFLKLCNTLTPCVSRIANSEADNSEKLAVLKAICDSFVPLTWTLNRYMNNLTVGSGQNKQRVLSVSEISSVSGNGILCLYELGDNIEKHLKATLPESMSCAAMAWKEGVSLQQKWYSMVKDKTLPEKYAAKIKAIEPDYEMPKKAGCIDFSANKK